MGRGAAQYEDKLHEDRADFARFIYKEISQGKIAKPVFDEDAAKDEAPFFRLAEMDVHFKHRKAEVPFAGEMYASKIRMDAWFPPVVMGSASDFHEPVDEHGDVIDEDSGYGALWWNDPSYPYHLFFNKETWEKLKVGFVAFLKAESDARDEAYWRQKEWLQGQREHLSAEEE